MQFYNRFGSKIKISKRLRKSKYVKVPNEWAKYSTK